MRAVKISRILARAEEFESELKKVYEQVSEGTVRKDLEMLARYMSRHRERINVAVSRLPEEQINRIRNTPLPYEPQAADWHCLSGFDLKAINSPEDLIDAAINFDDCLIDFYDQVARQAINQPTKDLFESLRCIEQKDERRLKTIKIEGIL